MNAPKIIEAAIMETIIALAPFRDAPHLRCFQAVDAERRWSASDDRTMPCVDIRASPPRTGTDGSTQAVSVAILIATQADDDPTHATLAANYDAVQTVCDWLYSSHIRSGASEQATAARAVFNAALASYLAGQTFDLGGFEMGEPMRPYLDSGCNFIGVELVVHYSRPEL